MAGQDYGKTINTVPEYVMTPENREVVKIFRNPDEGKFFWMDNFRNIFPLCDFSCSKNLISVDAVNGDDSKAALDPYNQCISFKTLKAAENAAQVGDTIAVYPGNYTVGWADGGPLVKGGVNWFFYPQTFVEAVTWIFAAFSVNINVYGYGNFISSGFATPAFVYNNSQSVVYCNSIVVQNPYYGAAYVENGAVVTFNIFDKVDASSNMANAFNVEGASKLIINCPEVRFSWIAYACSGNSQIIANVLKTIAYDYAGDFTSFATSYALIANVGENNLIKVYGDFYNAKTVDDPGPESRVSGALNIRAAGGEIHHIGNSSVTRGLRSIYCDHSMGKIFVNCDYQELQGNGVFVKRTGGIYLNKRLRAVLNPIKGVEDGGLCILNGAVLMSDTGLASIDGASIAVPPMNYYNYQGVANTPTAGANEAIGNPLLVNPLVI